jgi:WXG100 family type VII secretion target
MRSIQVSPEQLESSAARMNEAHDAYLRAVGQLYEAVEAMKAGWQGRDNIAFSNKIARFEGDFRQMAVLCAQYAEFLRSSAQSYRMMQQDLEAQVNSLGM